MVFFVLFCSLFLLLFLLFGVHPSVHTYVRAYVRASALIVLSSLSCPRRQKDRGDCSVRYKNATAPSCRATSAYST